MDRSDTSIFPEAYVSSLSARALPVSRGRGAQERNTGGKERGAKTPFLPSKRPKILNLRYDIVQDNIKERCSTGAE